MMIDEIASYLQLLGLGTVATNLFLSDAPANPDSIVTIYASGGQAPGYQHDVIGPALDNPTFQIIVRAKAYDEADSKAGAIWRALGSVTNQVLGATRFLQIRPLQSPIYLGKDENGRPEFSLNFQASAAV